MFGFSRKVELKEVAAPPAGADEVVLCVFDHKHRLLHHFNSHDDAAGMTQFFQFLNDPARSFEHSVLREATETDLPASLSLVYGDGYRKCLHVIPYQAKKGKTRYACLQIGRSSEASDRPDSSETCALAPDRFCLLLVDSDMSVQSTSSSIPKAFGYTSRNLLGMNMTDLFSGLDLEIMGSCSADTNEAILSCVFFCLDGSRRDVEIRKYSAPDNVMLYAISDMTPPQLAEEVSQVTTRERRRIGQDLHDSIGQMLTGISLLSRSLANSLKRIGNAGDVDASQISALADEASNQIRQISRGLMPADIVQKGLFDSLRELARNTTSSCGILCVTRIDETVEFADGAVETHLYRIAQEAVNNSVRHSGASRIDVIISIKNGLSRLEVIDNGIWKEMPENTSGIGMKTMEYRASAIGAQLKAGALPQGGSRVICVLEAEDLMAMKV
jgi:signal transduction histidine kinase